MSLWNKIVSFITGLVTVFTPAIPAVTPQNQTVEITPQVKDLRLGAANTKIRQEINITNDYLTAGSGSYATSSAIVLLQDGNYTGPTFYFEVLASTTAATNATVSLVNATSSRTIASVTINGTSPALYRSSNFWPTASSTEYRVVIGNESVGKSVAASRLVILQNSGAGDLTNTETQIEIGTATTTNSNTATLPMLYPKYWYYDSTKWDASPTFYAEVTYKITPTSSSTTYNVSATTTPTFYTYTASAGVGYVVGEAWGGGGGGDGVTSAATIGGGGGGGGTYARATTTVAPGSVNRIGVGRGGAEGTARADSASSTLRTASGLVLAAQGGEGATSLTGAATSSLSASVGGVIYAGGKGGDGNDTADTGGGGGGSAGPDGYGISGRAAATNGPGGTGGNGNLNLGGAGGAGGNGGDDTCDAENGGNGVNNVLGGGGGGGADGDVSSICTGGNGGRPGGGGGGSDEGGNSLGGPGQVKITEWIGTVGVAIEESDGTGDGFTGWAFKQQIVTAGLTSTTSERVRSASFTPTSGRNYRLVASTTNATASYDIYNAKIVVVQGGGEVVSDTYNESNVSVDQNVGNNTFSYGQSFTGNGGILSKARFYLKTNGSPSGTLTAKIFAHTGIYGTDGTPTGVALATSETYNASGLTGTRTLIDFQFIGVNNITLNSGTNYFLTLDLSGATIDASNLVQIGIDGSSPSHGGNWASFNGSSWTGLSGSDGVFYVYTTSLISLLQPQYLLANSKLAAGTALQKDLTDWDSTEWSTTNAYYLQAESANNSTSVVTLNEAGGTLVTNGTVTSPDNRGVSSAMCMPADGNLDTIATTNNGDIYAVRILVDVGGTPATCGSPVSRPRSIIRPNVRVIIPPNSRVIIP